MWDPNRLYCVELIKSIKLDYVKTTKIKKCYGSFGCSPDAMYTLFSKKKKNELRDQKDKFLFYFYFYYYFFRKQYLLGSGEHQKQ
jgi:hypothetical protein